MSVCASTDVRYRFLCVCFVIFGTLTFSVQLLHKLSIHADDGPIKLLKVRERRGIGERERERERERESESERERERDRESKLHTNKNITMYTFCTISLVMSHALSSKLIIIKIVFLN